MYIDDFLGYNKRRSLGVFARGAAPVMFVILLFFEVLRPDMARLHQLDANNYEAIAISDATQHGKIWRADLIVANGEYRGKKIRASFFTGGSPLPRPINLGTGVKLSAKMDVPQRMTGTHFDYDRWLKVHGYIGTTLVYPDRWSTADVDISNLSTIDRAMLHLLLIRRKLLRRLFGSTAHMTNEESLLAAMMLGDKSGLSKAMRDEYSVAGTSHVLALSGLHLSILIAMLSLLFRRRTVASSILMTATIWLFAFMVGMSPSVVRAALMFTVYLAVSLTSERGNSINTLAFSAMVILFIHPLSIYDVSFQLSFLSLLGILIVNRMLAKNDADVNVIMDDVEDYNPTILQRIGRFIKDSIIMSLAAQLMTFPLVMYYFGRFSCYFLLSNLVVVPLATMALYLSPLLLAFVDVPEVGIVLRSAVLGILRMMNEAVRTVASLPGSSIEGISVSMVQAALMYAAIGCGLLLASRLIDIWKIKSLPRPIR